MSESLLCWIRSARNLDGERARRKSGRIDGFSYLAPKYIVTADGRHRHKSAEGIQYEKRDIQCSADQARSSALLFPTIFFVPILYPSSFSFREFFQSLYSFLFLPILAFSQQHFIRLIYCSCILTTRPAHFFRNGKNFG
jgi:hypothetical protein